ncbi:ABC transporter substrate-binding protein [Actinophytocola oryzae]|uniref:ABC-type branched-subunit amino acid transport system substrate-binding protein n=1 Tax=Actinophytocola oryzae TaxID=502181 RepID=A0A4R7VKR0_9PSEU|nr:ABC transporter substrate-binding protein [Actinophytocola oryzae]TDV49837.1 ABC-type branched-subunit amino acid transport system substrate-binding protein [Actinophytocola oryzae]
MRPQTVLAACAAVVLLAAGCARSGPSGQEEDSPTATASSADFGDLKNVCQKGDAKSAPTQGVTADAISVGVFSDVGFTKKSEFVDAATVFTKWCNELGGVNGRELVATTRDSKLTEVPQRMLEACREDFALVGGGAALDALGVRERLTCLLPSFPAQVSMAGNYGSDLQVASLGGASYSRYAGFYHWLLKDSYPDSAGALGVISGDSAITKLLAGQTNEVLAGSGGTVTYEDLYPAQGVADWTPYAQSIKTKGVRGLVFLGDFTQLAKLEQALTNIGYAPDWIDANSNAYGPAFIQLAGAALDSQNNVADVSGVFPLEKADDNPATKQLVDLFARYAPDAEVTLPAVRAFAAWLLFAKAAGSCGDDLTRRCVYDAATKETAWTGGGLTAPADMSEQDGPIECFNVEKATKDGWEPADFEPDKGAYRCDAPVYRYQGQYPRPVTLADVGKSMNDVK